MSILNILKFWKKIKKEVVSEVDKNILFEDYFKDKIDWRFISTLEYALTKYQDFGITTCIQVCVIIDYASDDHSYGYVYHKQTGKEAEEVYKPSIDSDPFYQIGNYSKLYENYGLYYKISFPKIGKYEDRIRMLNRLKKRIGDKGFFVEIYSSDSVIYKTKNAAFN